MTYSRDTEEGRRLLLARFLATVARNSGTCESGLSGDGG